jgi:toxin ParE1/3/4
MPFTLRLFRRIPVKRYKVTYQEAASADILDIYRWVYEVSLDPMTAERFTARLLAACERIGDLPHAGRPRDDLLKGLRTVAFERRAVIAYVFRDEAVEITNVFYGRRDFESLMRGE